MITDGQLKKALKDAASMPVGKRIEIKDEGERGGGRLVLRVVKTKDDVTATWYALWWRGDERRYAKIASYSAMSLPDARKEFRTKYVPAILEGADPALANVRQRHDPDQSKPTIEALFQAYVAKLRADGARPRVIYDVERMFLLRDDAIAKVLGPKRLAGTIKPNEIVAILRAVRGTGAVVLAARVRSYLHAAFRYALTSENNYTVSRVGMSWGLDGNPVAAIPADQEARRTSNRFLSVVEVRTYWEWLIRRRAISTLADASRLNLATGQRIEEILRMSADGYERSTRMYHWDKTKNGKPHSIPLPKVACDILNKLEPHGPNRLYFPGIKDMSVPAESASVLCHLNAYAEDTGAESFTSRDLRRTWKTLSGRAGISKEMRDKLQNHAQGDVSSRHYDRYDYLTEKRAAVAKWEAFLSRLLAGELDDDRVAAEVVSIASAVAA